MKTKTKTFNLLLLLSLCIPALVSIGCGGSQTAEMKTYEPITEAEKEVIAEKKEAFQDEH
ncbi:secreted protein [Rhodopirellula maiorica SM1]|uniref:Secreted protein n=1 Tax=Rhodopirellula maiorica SM1 TaxID=1265738 RepID=M5RPG1_9BACT|nr:hypothetical protein [Rhodopirellula maiorica]EMI21185.1 secreted protein [Rhodopirellula maiorica SM1]